MKWQQLYYFKNYKAFGEKITKKMFKKSYIFFYKARVKEHQANEHDSQWIPLLTDKFSQKKIYFLCNFKLETNRKEIRAFWSIVRNFLCVCAKTEIFFGHEVGLSLTNLLQKRMMLIKFTLSELIVVNGLFGAAILIFVFKTG